MSKELYRLYDNETDEIALLETKAEPKKVDELIDKVRDEYDAYNVDDLKVELEGRGYGCIFISPNEVHF